MSTLVARIPNIYNIQFNAHTDSFDMDYQQFSELYLFIFIAPIIQQIILAQQKKQKEAAKKIVEAVQEENNIFYYKIIKKKPKKNTPIPLDYKSNLAKKNNQYDIYDEIKELFEEPELSEKDRIIDYELDDYKYMGIEDLFEEPELSEKDRIIDYELDDYKYMGIEDLFEEPELSEKEKILLDAKKFFNGIKNCLEEKKLSFDIEEIHEAIAFRITKYQLMLEQLVSVLQNQNIDIDDIKYYVDEAKGEIAQDLKILEISCGEIINKKNEEYEIWKKRCDEQQTRQKQIEQKWDENLKPYKSDINWYTKAYNDFSDKIFWITIMRKNIFLKPNMMHQKHNEISECIDDLETFYQKCENQFYNKNPVGREIVIKKIIEKAKILFKTTAESLIEMEGVLLNDTHFHCIKNHLKELAVDFAKKLQDEDSTINEIENLLEKYTEQVNESISILYTKYKNIISEINEQQQKLLDETRIQEMEEYTDHILFNRTNEIKKELYNLNLKKEYMKELYEIQNDFARELTDIFNKTQELIKVKPEIEIEFKRIYKPEETQTQLNKDINILINQIKEAKNDEYLDKILNLFKDEYKIKINNLENFYEMNLHNTTERKIEEFRIDKMKLIKIQNSFRMQSTELLDKINKLSKNYIDVNEKTDFDNRLNKIKEKYPIDEIDEIILTDIESLAEYIDNNNTDIFVSLTEKEYNNLLSILNNFYKDEEEQYKIKHPIKSKIQDIINKRKEKLKAEKKIIIDSDSSDSDSDSDHEDSDKNINNDLQEDSKQPTTQEKLALAIAMRKAKIIAKKNSLDNNIESDSEDNSDSDNRFVNINTDISQDPMLNLNLAPKTPLSINTSGQTDKNSIIPDNSRPKQPQSLLEQIQQGMKLNKVNQETEEVKESRHLETVIGDINIDIENGGFDEDEKEALDKLLETAKMQLEFRNFSSKPEDNVRNVKLKILLRRASIAGTSLTEIVQYKRITTNLATKNPVIATITETKEGDKKIVIIEKKIETNIPKPLSIAQLIENTTTNTDTKEERIKRTAENKTKKSIIADEKTAQEIQEKQIQQQKLAQLQQIQRAKQKNAEEQSDSDSEDNHDHQKPILSTKIPMQEIILQQDNSTKIPMQQNIILQDNFIKKMIPFQNNSTPGKQSKKIKKTSQIEEDKENIHPQSDRK